jgi:alkylation response protein AidB-like acyl-CoA dehydrogenase
MTEVGTSKEDRYRQELRDWLANVDRPDGLREYGSTPSTRDVEAARAWQAILFQAGWAGLSWPKEHGGQGATVMEQAIFAEEAAMAEVPRFTSLTSMELAGPMIFQYGTPEQQQRFLPRILNGEDVWCQLFSEPEAGSDLASLKASAAPRPEGGWKVNGQKIWSSGGHYAEVGLLLARTDKEERHRGISCFLLPMDRPGLEIRPIRQIDDEQKFSEVFFDDVPLEPGDLLGEVGEGWKIALSTLGRERLSLGAEAVGMTRMLLRVRESVALDGELAERYAELWGRIAALRITWLRLIGSGAGGQDPRYSALKMMASSLRQQIPRLASEAIGAEAVAGPGLDWSEALLASLSSTIAGGTSEIQRGIIGERVLGLPR